jgi:hypothetical protein
MEKSFTVTLALFEIVNEDPGTVIVALSLIVPGPAVGVTITVMVAVALAFIVPRLQTTVAGVPVAPPQVPPVAVADTKVAFAGGSVSVNVTPEVRSPTLVTVNVNVTGFPTPTVGAGVPTPVIVKFAVGLNLLMKASLPPFNPP